VTEYRIKWTLAAAKTFSDLPKNVQERIAPKVNALAQNPHPPGSKKLVGMDDLFRIRIGDYRIVYQVKDEILFIIVVNVGNRKDVYRRK